jgi:hypothetical protein
MTDPKKSDQKVFTSIEQLEAELFPNKTFVADDGLPEKEEVGEADILAKKLINDLMHQTKKKNT